MSRAMRDRAPVNYGENAAGRTPAWLRKTSGLSLGRGREDEAEAEAVPRMKSLGPARADKPARAAGGGDKENAGGASPFAVASPGDFAGADASPPRAAKAPAADKKAAAARKGKPSTAAATVAGLAAKLRKIIN